MEDAIVQRLYQRLRTCPIDHTVPGSLPVLSFGSLDTARIATVGLNPSRLEFVDKGGQELVGEKRRLETLLSLEAENRESLTDEQCARALTRMQAYFQPKKPVLAWFVPLDKLTRAMGYAYQAGEVAHVDLVQEATDPTWTALRKLFLQEVSKAQADDEKFLVWQLETYSLVQAVICNGRWVSNEMLRLLNGRIVANGFYVAPGATTGRKWFVGLARIGERTLCLLGWDKPLANAPGLTDQALQAFGALLLNEAENHGCSLS